MTRIRLKLEEMRKAQGFSMRALARKAGLRHATLSAIEAGTTRRVDFNVLEKLSVALGVDPARLIGQTDSKRRGK